MFDFIQLDMYIYKKPGIDSITWWLIFDLGWKICYCQVVRVKGHSCLQLPCGSGGFSGGHCQVVGERQHHDAGTIAPTLQTLYCKVTWFLKEQLSQGAELHSSQSLAAFHRSRSCGDDSAGNPDRLLLVGQSWAAGRGPQPRSRCRRKWGVFFECWNILFSKKNMSNSHPANKVCWVCWVVFRYFIPLEN